MSGLTPKQAECLLFISAHITAHRASPTYDQIKAALGLASKSGVHRLVEGLVERGHLRHIPARARSLEVVQHACPHCGGALVDLPPPQIPKPRTYAHRVVRGAAYLRDLQEGAR